eukprot:gene6142-7817_t
MVNQPSAQGSLDDVFLDDMLKHGPLETISTGSISPPQLLTGQTTPNDMDFIDNLDTISTTGNAPTFNHPPGGGPAGADASPLGGENGASEHLEFEFFDVFDETLDEIQDSEGEGVDVAGTDLDTLSPLKRMDSIGRGGANTDYAGRDPSVAVVAAEELPALNMGLTELVGLSSQTGKAARNVMNKPNLAQTIGKQGPLEGFKHPKEIQAAKDLAEQKRKKEVRATKAQVSKQSGSPKGSTSTGSGPSGTTGASNAGSSDTVSSGPDDRRK